MSQNKWLKEHVRVKSIIEKTTTTGFQSNTTHIRACNTACPSKNI